MPDAEKFHLQERILLQPTWTANRHELTWWLAWIDGVDGASGVCLAGRRMSSEELGRRMDEEFEG